MSYRFMRILLFFDLPSITALEMKEYRKFRKHLIKSGFVMLQESVYCKLALNTTVSNAIIENIKKNKPPTGLVQMLVITEKQYAKMEFIVGERHSDIVDSDERLVVL